MGEDGRLADVQHLDASLVLPPRRRSHRERQAIAPFQTHTAHLRLERPGQPIRERPLPLRCRALLDRRVLHTRVALQLRVRFAVPGALTRERVDHSPQLTAWPQLTANDHIPHGELSLRARSPARAPPRRTRRRRHWHRFPSRGRRDARTRLATQGPPAPNDSRPPPATHGACHSGAAA